MQSYEAKMLNLHISYEVCRQKKKTCRIVEYRRQ